MYIARSLQPGRDHARDVRGGVPAPAGAEGGVCEAQETWEAVRRCEGGVAAAKERKKERKKGRGGMHLCIWGMATTLLTAIDGEEPV